jgi:hypothetical protein
LAGGREAAAPTMPRPWSGSTRRWGEVAGAQAEEIVPFVAALMGLCLAYLLVRPHQPVASVEIEQVVRDRAPDAELVATTSARERARVNVTRALSAALLRLEPHHPELVGHLRATLRVGAFCTYTPDPRVAAAWES